MGHSGPKMTNLKPSEDERFVGHALNPSTNRFSPQVTMQLASNIAGIVVNIRTASPLWYAYIGRLRWKCNENGRWLHFGTTLSGSRPWPPGSHYFPWALRRVGLRIGDFPRGVWYLAGGREATLP